MNLMLVDANVGSLVLVLVLLVACVGMFMLSYFRNKKYAQQQQEMLEKVQVGAKVLTKTFVYGTIEKITDTTDGKVVLLKTGEGDKVSYLEMNMDAIYAIDNKEEVVDMEEIEQGEVAFKEEETTVEEVNEEKKEETKKSAKKAK